MTRALAFLTALLTVLLVAAQARAQQQRIELRSGVDPDTIEVGQTATYTVQVMVHGGGAPSGVVPGPTVGVTLVGAVGSAPMQMRSNVNGVTSETNGLTTSWQIRADKPGTFTLGPAQVTVSGTRRTVPAARLTVVPRGSGRGQPQRRNAPVDPFAGSPFGGSTLDPFKGLFDFGDDDDRRREPAAPTADPKLSMDAARAPVAFLHATVDKTRAVVGEQVTLTVYLYEDPYARQGRPGDVHEPTANDFVKRSLLEDETHAIGVGTASVGGKPWNVKLVRKNALFPLKAGKLVIEPMSMTLPQARVGLRESERIAIDVTEPPLDGRPPGYAMGDVGDMALQATVAPRSVTRDGAIGVTLELRGTGNLPGQLALPVVLGVEWLEQQTHDKLGALEANKFGGTRTFSYVVRLHKEGAIDLGEVRLPYFDPERRAYATARATIGIVNVAPGAARDAGADEPEPVLAGMPKERRVLEGALATSYVTERPWFWLAMFGSPVGCALALGAQGLVRRARERRASHAPSPEKIARERRAEAELACKGDDGAAAMGAVARAVEAEVLASTEVNLRGAAGADGRRELEEAGASAEAARAVTDVLRACEDARFSPDGVSIDEARAAWERAKAALELVSIGGKRA